MGWSSAGAAAAGLAVGVVAGAAIASSNTAAATNNAYAAGVATGSANTAAAYNAGVVAGAGFAMGTIYATLPVGSITTNVQGQTYYLNGNNLVSTGLRRQWRLLPRGARALKVGLMPA